MRMTRDDTYDSTGFTPGTREELGEKCYRLNRYLLDARGKARKLPRKGNTKLHFLLTLRLAGSRVKNQIILRHEVERATEE